MKQLSRRDFLKLSAIAAGTTALAACGAPTDTSISMLASSAKANATSPDLEALPASTEVIVLGAGMAGLAAARMLVDKNHRVVLLEGRNRIGGRAWTDSSLGVPLDLGASWIHGVQGNPLTALANKAGAAMVVTDYERMQRYSSNGQELPDSEDRKIDNDFENLMAKLDAYRETLDDDISLQKGIQNVLGRAPTPPMAYALNSAIEHEYAGALTDLSLFEWDQDGEFGGNDVIFPKGYIQLVRKLAAGLDIRTSQVVKQVKYDTKGVSIQTNTGLAQAKYAVVTFPLGVLKSRSVSFSPALPAAKRNAIARLKMGVLNKLYLKFPSVFWDKQAHLLGYLGAQTGAWAEWLNLYPLTQQPVLLGFNAAAYGLALEQKSDQAIVAEAMSVLRAIHGNAIPNPTGWLVTRWGRDPFAFGSYSHIPPGASGKDYDALAAPVAKRLFFAGEATSRKYPATVHGAYLSGQRAAGEILALG